MGLFSGGPGHVALEPPTNPSAGIKLPDPVIVTNKKYMNQVLEFREAVLAEAKSGSLDKWGRDAAAGLVKSLVVGADEEELDTLISEMALPAAVGLACLAAEDAKGWRRRGVTDRRVQFFLDTVGGRVQVRTGLGLLAAYIAQAVYFHGRLHPEGGMVPMPEPGFRVDYKVWKESSTVE